MGSPGPVLTVRLGGLQPSVWQAVCLAEPAGHHKNRWHGIRRRPARLFMAGQRAPRPVAVARPLGQQHPAAATTWPLNEPSLVP